MKKCKFDLLTPSPGSGGGACGQNICYHVAAFMMPLNLICNKTISVKVKVWPTDRFGRVWGSAVKVFATVILFICSMTLF